MEKKFINVEMTLSIPTEDLKSIYPAPKIKSCEEKHIINEIKNIELFTVLEVAKKLKVNVNSVYYLIKKGHLTALKLGSLKVTSSELERFIKWAEGKDFTDLNNVKELEFN